MTVDELGAKLRRDAREAGEVPPHLRIAIANATRAFRDDDLRALATVNENLQPLVDAAIAWGRRREQWAEPCDSIERSRR